MNSSEIEQVYQSLMAFLRDSNYQNIASYVQEQVEEGYIKKEKVKIDRSLLQQEEIGLSTLNGSRNTSTRILYRKAEYSPKERLLLLLNAIESAIVKPVLIRNRVAEFFKGQAAKTDQIQDPDVKLYQSVDESVEALTTNVDQTQQELERLNFLIRAIGDLRKELNNGLGE